jgi:hypothetical protein
VTVQALGVELAGDAGSLGVLYGRHSIFPVTLSMDQNPLPDQLSFGDFTVHRRERSLRRHGIRLNLHGQSFDILILLLERAAEVVTREELQAKLWKANSYGALGPGGIERARDACGSQQQASDRDRRANNPCFHGSPVN